MSQYTKGKWKAISVPFENGQQYVICCGKTVASVKTRIGDNYLISAAVNACIAVNPDNPQAATEAIGDMYAALNLILKATQFDGYLPNARSSWKIIRDKCVKAINKADGRE